MPINITFGKENFQIPTHTTEDFNSTLQKIKSCQNRVYDPPSKTWYIPIDDYNFKILSNLLNGEDGEKLAQVSTSYNERIFSLEFPTSLPLYLFQKQGASFVYHKLISNGGVLLGDEPGLGKTLTALAVYERLHNEGLANNLLVSCYTKALKPEWEQHLKKFTSYPYLSINGSKEEREEKYKDFGRVKVQIIHHDLMRCDLSLMPKADMLIIDETLKLKGYKNKTLKAFKSYAKGCKYLLLLSGSPIENNLQELYNIVNIIKPRFFGSFRSFADDYIIYEKTYVGYNKYVNTVKGYKNLSNLKERLRDVLIRRYKSEVAKELPPIIPHNYYAELNDEQRRVYNYIADDLVKDLERGVVDNLGFINIQRETLLAKLMFLRRVCDSSFLIKNTDSNLIPQKIKDSISPCNATTGGKFEVLEDILPLLNIKDDKLVIFTQWRDSCDLIYDFLPTLTNEGIVKVHGGVKDIDKKLEEFKTSSGINILVADDLISHGLNLQVCSNCIHFDIFFNPDRIVQRTSRFHRLVGTTKPVNSYFIYTKNTIETGHLIEVINRKVNLSRQVLDEEGRSILLQILKGGMNERECERSIKQY